VAIKLKEYDLTKTKQTKIKQIKKQERTRTTKRRRYLQPITKIE